VGALDAILGQVLSASGAPQDKQSTDLVTGMLGMLAGGGGGGQASAAGAAGLGGLGGLVQQFEKAGLGSLVQTWVGTGKNAPATPQQIEQGLGQANILSLAQKLGISPQMVLSQLVVLLPVIIDKLTPKGQVPAQSELDKALSGLGSLGSLGSLAGSLLGGRKP
jgi:uncharacterized protein YidB (DUF937 family)